MNIEHAAACHSYDLVWHGILTLSLRAFFANNIKKFDRRKVFQVACGNNCTIILAGPFQPPTLFELCLEVVVKEDPKSIEHLGLLPQDKLLQMTGKSSP